MTKTEIFEKTEKIGSVLVNVLTLIVFLFLIFSAVYIGYTLSHEKQKNQTVEEWHKDLVLDGDYVYCPYCGEKLKE